MIPAVMTGLVPRWAGVVMMASLVAYVFYQYRASRLDTDAVEGADHDTPAPWAMLLVGIATLVVGSEILIQGAVAGGVALGVPEAVIGMTLIAVGTSLPELTACVAAARKGQSEVIVGGIVGSNIFNILSVLALSAAVKPLVIAPRFAAFDMPVAVAVTAVFAGFLLFGNRIGRTAGWVMLLCYIAFVVAQYTVVDSLV
jgi:cation:H+ antiporter